MPFASINPTNPRTNIWNFRKNILRIGNFEKLSLFWFHETLLNNETQMPKLFAPEHAFMKIQLQFSQSSLDFNQLWNPLIWNRSISHFRVYFHSTITKGQFMWTRIRKISNVTYVITQVMPNDILLIIKQKLMGNTNICVSSVDENSNILGIWKGKNSSWYSFTNSRFHKFTKWPIF